MAVHSFGGAVGWVACEYIAFGQKLDVPKNISPSVVATNFPWRLVSFEIKLYPLLMLYVAARNVHHLVNTPHLPLVSCLMSHVRYLVAG